MKKFLIFIFTFLSDYLISQEDVRIFFKDKPGSSNFMNSPLNMLTRKSVNRKNKQGRVFDIKDIPIGNYNYIKTSTSITVLAKFKWLNAVQIHYQ